MTDFRGVATLLIGTAILVVGARIRLGRDRRWITLYRNANLPAALRNAPFLLIPVGATLVLGGLVEILPADPELLAIRLAAAVALSLAVGGLLVGLSTPPALLMPRWFIESGEPRLRRDRFDRAVSIAAVIGLMAIALSLVVLFALSR
jgi:hypothetical protein